MDEERLREIEGRAKAAHRLYGEHPMPARAVTGEEYATDVSALVAEVRRLRDERDLARLSADALQEINGEDG